MTWMVAPRQRMTKHSTAITAVGAIAGTVLALSGCSFTVTRSYDPAIGKQYLAAVCPAHQDLARLDTAQRSQDIPAFTAAAATVRDDLYTQISDLQYPRVAWPDPIGRQVRILVAADSKGISMFGQLSTATTAAEIQAVRAPDTTAAQKASEEIRAELNLPATSAGGGC